MKKFVEQKLDGTDYFLVDLSVSPDNDIVVEIDSPSYVDIDFCTALNAAISGEFDRDVEDYSLEVGSAGITSPFKVKEQYFKNVGNKVEVLANGKKHKGILKEADSDGFILTEIVKEKVEGQKKPVMVEKDTRFPYADAKSVTRILEF